MFDVCVHLVDKLNFLFCWFCFVSYPMKHRHFKTLGVPVSNTLGTLLHACPHCIGREKNIYLFKKVSFDYKYVFKDFDSCYLC
jgi:hypothetical protein